ncbi:hypothetical protein HYH96_17085 [Clostridium botulinum]|uniref:Uncharacterized protein n=1 Tax=Clostridium botulinum (strain Okra / Type B1) TaxID=498213 RepID=B1INW8_CLOBK|nr:hypothetical protein [Clostridium botulinum]EKX78820.1 hypothetical protein CFSAN001628_016929 [Clostridium botulinum CFSAN001628]ACA47108.1 conserved hypothetical protein [Clostridium botulinum B1 str. Okra]MBD5564690.1 hypothetical protein [Clostridium botulinum]MBD5568527.1 hypothetical protein [Clostridium botulinum]MBD5572258.1 hypothetical protein [Clostridium botulinum]
MKKKFSTFITNNIKEHIKDNTVKGYHLVFKLINNMDISFSTTVEEFNKIKEWYESENKESYSIKQDNRYVSLNKVNIVEFSYSTITNKKEMLNPIMYILTTPAPRIIDIFNYCKGIVLIPIISLVAYIIYERYMLNVEIKNILSNTIMINQILRSSFMVISVIFILHYIAFFLFKMLGLNLNEDKDLIYKLKNQTKNKVYTYASFNFVIIILLSCVLRSFRLI